MFFSIVLFVLCFISNPLFKGFCDNINIYLFNITKYKYAIIDTHTKFSKQLKIFKEINILNQLLVICNSRRNKNTHDGGECEIDCSTVNQFI